MRTSEDILEDLRRAEESRDWPSCIALCREGLAATSLGYREEWFVFGLNLARFLLNLDKNPGLDAYEDVHGAIALYREMLTRVSPESDEREWGVLQFSLAGAYGRLRGTDRGAHVERALEHFRASLTYYTKERDPYRWAVITAGIGLAYSERVEGNPRDNLMMAIQSYQACLRIFNREDYPSDWEDTVSVLESLESELRMLDER